MIPSDGFQVSDIAHLTILWYETPLVPDVKVREGAVNMGAYFLSCLGGSEYSDYRHPGRVLLLSIPIASGQLRIECCGCSLVVINAIEPDAETVHRRLVGNELKERDKSERIMEGANIETVRR